VTRQPVTWTVRRGDDGFELIDGGRDELARLEDVTGRKARVDRPRELLDLVHTAPALTVHRHQVRHGHTKPFVVGDRGRFDEHHQPGRVALGRLALFEIERARERRSDRVGKICARGFDVAAQQQRQRTRIDRLFARERVERAIRQPLDGFYRFLQSGLPAIPPQPCNYNERMVAVRYVALMALVVWVGGMIVLGLLVAPSTFRVLQVHEGAAGRILAGMLFGDILRQFYILAYVCGGIILSSLIIMKLMGPPPRAFTVRAAIVAFMLALAVYAGVPVSREIGRIQSQVAGPMNQLPDSDPRRARFDRLHTTSTALMTVNMVLGLILLCWYVRE